MSRASLSLAATCSRTASTWSQLAPHIDITHGDTLGGTYVSSGIEPLILKLSARPLSSTCVDASAPPGAVPALSAAVRWYLGRLNFRSDSTLKVTHDRKIANPLQSAPARVLGSCKAQQNGSSVHVLLTERDPFAFLVQHFSRRVAATSKRGHQLDLNYCNSDRRTSIHTCHNPTTTTQQNCDAWVACYKQAGS